jgi:hypothetical protein
VIAIESPGIGVSLWNNLFIGAGGIPLVRLVHPHGNVIFQGNGYAGPGSPLARHGTNLVHDLDAWRALGLERLAGHNTGFAFVPSLDLTGPRGLAGELERLSSLH